MNAVTSVITKEQAKQITGGRTPLVPVEYETAVNALAACIAIDEAKTWSDKADALAAWAKIYHSRDAERKAKQLRLHAYRRMGEIAKELRPRQTVIVEDSRVPSGKRPQTDNGPRSVLMEVGLENSQAYAALSLADMSQSQFDALTSAKRIPAPVVAMQASRPDAEAIQIAGRLSGMATAIRKLPPREYLKAAPPSTKSCWRENAEEIYTWLTVVLQKRHQ